MPSIMDDSSVIAQVTQEADNVTDNGRRKDNFNLQDIRSGLATDVNRLPAAVKTINFRVERSSVIRYDQQCGGIGLNRDEGSIDGNCTDHAIAAVNRIEQTMFNRLTNTHYSLQIIYRR